MIRNLLLWLCGSALLGCVDDVVSHDPDPVDAAVGLDLNAPVPDRQVPEVDADAGPDLPRDARIVDDAGLDAAPVDTELGPARARFPWNGYRTGSVWGGGRRPTFQWEEVPGADRYELRLDASCTAHATCRFPDPLTFMFDRTRVTLDVDLPVSLEPPVGARFYWSVRACRVDLQGDSECSEWTPTRYLDVGHERGDYNGDGYADLVVGAPSYDRQDGNMGAHFVFEGGPAGLSPEPTLQIAPASVGGANYWPIANVGDTNGDGYADFACMGSVLGSVGSGLGSLSEARLYLHLGSAAGLHPEPSFVLAEDPTCKFATYYINGAGDLNGDGFADLALVTQTPEGCGGARDEGDLVLIFYGAEAGLVEGPRLRVSGPFASFGRGFVKTAAGVGDVDGDGYTDLVVAVADWNFIRPAFVYRGGVNGLEDPPAYRLAAPERFVERFTFPFRVPSVGDVNGDGFADIVATTRQFQEEDAAGEVHLFAGSRAGPPGRPTATLFNSEAQTIFGWNITGGDLNGDGYGDIAMDIGGYEPAHHSEVRVHLGGPNGLSPAGERLPGDTSTAVVSPGDFDGTGSMDLVVGTFGLDGVGGVEVLLGGPDGLAPPVVLPNPTLGPERGTWGWGNFGAHVADSPF